MEGNEFKQASVESFCRLTTARTVIRRFTTDDIAALHAIRTDPTVALYQSWDDISEEAMIRFIHAMKDAEPGRAGEWFQFAIVLRETGELIGDCGIHTLAEDPRLGEIGYTLAKKFQGQGLAQEAVSAILTYIFSTHKHHRIAAIVDVRNSGSIKLLERLGFRREGRTRRAFWNHGEWVDEYIYAILRDEWLQREQSTYTTKVALLGTGTPNADPERHGSAVAIIAGNEEREQAYLVDCGPGIVRRAAAAAQRGIKALAMPHLTRLFLTHHHSDHTTGLPDLMLTPWVLGRAAPLVIYGPVGTRAMVEHLLAAYAEDIRERREGLEPSNDQGHRIEVHEYTAGEIYRDDLVRVEAFRVQHGSWPAYGLRFTTADRTVVISGDTRPFDRLTEHYRDVDLLIHEVYSTAGFQRKSARWQAYHAAVHTSTKELAALANETRPGLLVLVHQLFWGTSEDELLAEIAEEYAGPVISGHDLDIF